jgi:hypothetical protein
MSSVWLTAVAQKTTPKKMIGHLSEKEARRYMRAKALEFIKASADPAAPALIKLVGEDTVLMFHGDELLGSMHIEFLSPPTKAAKGDNWVKREAH